MDPVTLTALFGTLLSMVFLLGVNQWDRRRREAKADRQD